MEENWDDNEVPAMHALVVHQNREYRRRNRPKEKRTRGGNVSLFIFVCLEPNPGPEVVWKPQTYADRSLVAMFDLKYISDI